MGLIGTIQTKMQTRKGKVFMAYLYGWGASVVILGALFKINHYPGANEMLIIGLTTESIIFFFSVFEPIHEELDWSLVYPELAHMEEGAEADSKEHIPKGTITEQLDRMLEDAKIGPDLISSLSAGMKNLSSNASNLSDLSEATVATSKYSDNVKKASESIGTLNDTYTKNNQAMQDLAGVSSNVKENLSSIVSTSNQYNSGLLSGVAKIGELNESYGKAVSAMDEIGSSTEGTRNYNQQIGKLTTNLASLNSIYEIDLHESNAKLMNTINDLSATSEASKPMIEQMNQLTQSLTSLNVSFSSEAQESQQRTNVVKEFYSGISEILENIQQSAEGAKKSREEVSKLGENLAALNHIYGNMLAAMNVNIGGRSAS